LGDRYGCFKGNEIKQSFRTRQTQVEKKVKLNCKKRLLKIKKSIALHNCSIVYVLVCNCSTLNKKQKKTKENKERKEFLLIVCTKLPFGEKLRRTLPKLSGSDLHDSVSYELLNLKYQWFQILLI
jgi:hypothetical protein